MIQGHNTTNEIEAKFYVSSLKKMEELLISGGGQCIRNRTLETNIRFDTSNGSFTSTDKVVRLRKDSENVLTFKGPATIVDGVKFREEIELRVGDFSEAYRLLTTLDFLVILKYEKYRKIYRINESFVMLDELPYGPFVEIESDNSSTIHKISAQLGLRWERQVFDTYTDIFRKLKVEYHWDFQDLTFANFSTRSFKIEQIGILVADKSNKNHSE
jgi:predicted adenylyl cyclase CyaB